MDTNPWPPIPAHAIEIAGRPMLPERLTEIDGKPYVRCYLHGLIPADHRCAESPGDHFCGVSAHPNQTEGEHHDDQAVSHEEWDRIQSMKWQNWKRTAEIAIEALRVADEYLDGFVWLTEPEFSELRNIKRASKRAQRRVAVLTEHNGLSPRQLDRLNAAHSAGLGEP